MKKALFITLIVFLITDAFSQSNLNEEVDSNFENRKQRGHYNITQIGMLMGNRRMSERSYNNPYGNLQIAPSVTMINGTMSDEGWGVGVGVGFEIFDHNLFPVFVDIRHIRRDNDVTPFFALKIGYSIGNIDSKHYDNLYLDYQPYYANNVYLRNHGGIMVHPEMGIKIPLNEKSDLMLTVAYRYQKIKTTVSQVGQNYEWEHKASMNRLSFGVAIMFK